MIIFDTQIKEFIVVTKKDLILVVGAAFKKIPQNRVPYKYKVFQYERKNLKKRRRYYIVYIQNTTEVPPVLFAEENAPAEGTKIKIDNPAEIRTLTYKIPADYSVVNKVPGVKIGFLLKEEK